MGKTNVRTNDSPLTTHRSPLTNLVRIEMLLSDVDGVLTDGRIVYTDEGVELKAFHARDGAGLKLWRRLGKRAGILTGRKSRVVELRSAELGLDVVVQGAEAKYP